MFRNIRLWWARRQLSPEQLRLLEELKGEWEVFCQAVLKAHESYRSSEEGRADPTNTEKEGRWIESCLDRQACVTFVKAMDACAAAGIPKRTVKLALSQKEETCSA